MDGISGGNWSHGKYGYVLSALDGCGCSMHF
jgi:hypothetical protein